MFFQKDIETMKRSELESLQLARLRALVSYCYRNVPFYKKKLDDAKIDPDGIRSLSDLQHLPFTTKADIRDNYPYGLFAQPLKKIVRIHASSGTTGKPTVVGYTKNDLDMWSDCVARLCVSAGATEDDVAQIAFGYGLFTGALGLHYGLEKIGAAVVPTSSGNTEKSLMLMKDFGTTTLIATPSYAMYMAETAKELGYDMERDFKMRLGLFGSEGCTPELRSRIEEAWGIFATDNYGMSELIGPGVSGECEYRCGLHVWEDHFLPEIINSETGEQLKEGEIGELVVTTLTKEGIPLIRYRTKDISCLDYSPCRCGRTHVRMAKVMGRSDDMFKIRGVNVFPSQVESVLGGFSQIGPHYELVLTRSGYVDAMEVRVELIDGSVLDRYQELEGLRQMIRGKLKTVLGIDSKVNLVSPKTLERFSGKAKRVIDLRNKGENE